MTENNKELLMSPEEFLKSGVHIGTRYKTNGMKEYIYSVRKDGLKVLSIETISDRIRETAEMILKYEPSRVAIVGRRSFATTPIKKMCSILEFKPFTGRFIPGTFTNTSSKTFFEPRFVLITESDLDKQAILEALEIGAGTAGFCSTNNETEGLNLVIPSNNKGRKSLAILYWLLTREILFLKGVIKTRQEFTHKIEDFEFKGRDVKTFNKKKLPRRGNNVRREGFNNRRSDA